MELAINTRDWPQINRAWGHTKAPVFSFSKVKFKSILFINVIIFVIKTIGCLTYCLLHFITVTSMSKYITFLVYIHEQ